MYFVLIKKEVIVGLKVIYPSFDDDNPCNYYTNDFIYTKF